MWCSSSHRVAYTLVQGSGAAVWGRAGSRVGTAAPGSTDCNYAPRSRRQKEENEMAKWGAGKRKWRNQQGQEFRQKQRDGPSFCMLLWGILTQSVRTSQWHVHLEEETPSYYLCWVNNTAHYVFRNCFSQIYTHICIHTHKLDVNRTIPVSQQMTTAPGLTQEDGTSIFLAPNMTTASACVTKEMKKNGTIKNELFQTWECLKIEF